jgi:Zn-dependent peptidase ImmA (M78 family)/DNA-binding XRE family transcriptional regulator
MPRGVEALVEPALLAWARTSAGLEVERAARRAQVSPERLESWERGDSRPTVNQLRKLGKAYKRPLAVFYLPEPPRDFQALRDFRRLPGRVTPPESSELRFAIRVAQDRRELALDLYEVIGEEPPRVAFAVTLADEPEHVATNLRELLKVRYQDQVRWTAGYEALNRWRAALEASGVLVFQAIDVEPSEIRGFSIYADLLPAIVVNIKDSVRGRVFTMLHELAHIALRQTGMCDLTEQAQIGTDEQRVEVFCNRVAGATLVPRDYLLLEDAVAVKRDLEGWTDEEIQALADRYGASREVILRRLLICGRTTEAFYRRKREELQREYEGAERRREGGFAPPHRIAVSSAGPLFVRLVLDSYHQDHITASDVADLLGVRLKHLGRIESEVLRSAS